MLVIRRSDKYVVLRDKLQEYTFTDNVILEKNAERRSTSIILYIHKEVSHAEPRVSIFCFSGPT